MSLIDITRLRKNRARLGRTISKMNGSLLSNTDQLIEDAVATGTKWQKLASKSINKGMPLVSRQFDMTFDSLETLKKQVSSGRIRLNELFEIDSRDSSNERDAQEGVDLTTIKGIGPKLATILHSNGVKTMEDLSNIGAEELRMILESAGSRYKSLNPEIWIEQAKEIQS